MSEFVSFTVPMTPPSVNHYKVRYRNGRTVVSDEAITFKQLLALAARDKSVQAKTFSVNMTIYLAKGQKGDVDNFPKLVLDGLADAGVFRNLKGIQVSDAHVRHMDVTVDTDERPEVGRTEIWVGALR